MNIHTGNAAIDGADTRGWIVGSFMPEGDIRRTSHLETKWAMHKKGTTRSEWTTDEKRTTVCASCGAKVSIATGLQTRIVQPLLSDGTNQDSE